MKAAPANRPKISKNRPQSQNIDERKNREVLKVNPTQCIWTDNDTNKKYLIDNKGSEPVYVNSVGQIPSRFALDVTGVKNYWERQKVVKSNTLAADQALAMKVEAPKSLVSVTKQRHQYYTPVQQKFYGYAQMPRQLGMPYQNQLEYQKLLKRHIDKGQMLQTFDFPATQGKMLNKKSEQTQQVLESYGTIPSNQRYGKRINLKLTMPD